jgi:integrase
LQETKPYPPPTLIRGGGSTTATRSPRSTPSSRSRWAVNLRWGDVDAANLRLRLPRSQTKRDQPRWVYLPELSIDAIEDTCPLEDRTPQRRVFQGITEHTAYQAMARACKTAKVPHYHPHDLRHRRITVWHQSGIPARELAERAGHAKPSMSLDVYSHILPADEVPEKAFRELLKPSVSDAFAP